MINEVEQIRKLYDEGSQSEWDRLERHPFEFEINKRFIGRYVKPGEKVLDIGGGPGRYSLYFAGMGCDVTLADLSPGNVAFARMKAREMGLDIHAHAMDARDLSALHEEQYDHVLLMGTLYHLTDEQDRICAVTQALSHLKPGGTLSTSFISSYAGIIYAMKFDPAVALRPDEAAYNDTFIHNEPFSGISFTYTYFIRQQDVVPFMEQFPVTTLHMLGSEGIASPCEPMLTAQSPEVMAYWLDMVEKTCERQDLLSYAEHFLHIGRKS